MKGVRKILVGADPELFLSKGGEIISAVGVIPGDKKKPFPTSVGAVQVDNVLAEFNIVPASTRQAFISNVTRTMSDLRLLLPAGVDFTIKASHNYSIDYLIGQKGAFEFGCVPDYSIYSKGKQTVVVRDHSLRSAGGHLHVGGSFVLRNKGRIVQSMDYLIALPGVLLDPDTKRRQLYGCAGSYRPKPYGLEYRTPSNFWIKSPELMGWAYDQVIRATNEYDSMLDEWQHILPPNELQRIINESDVAEAARYKGIYGELDGLLLQA